MARFVGDSDTEIYHREDCSEVNEIDPENMIYFENADEAEDSGFDPCPTCIPRDAE